MTGPPTYASGLTIKINPYGRIIKPAEFNKKNQRIRQGKHPVQTRRPETRTNWLSRKLRSPGEEDLPEKERYRQELHGAPEMLS